MTTRKTSNNSRTATGTPKKPVSKTQKALPAAEQEPQPLLEPAWPAEGFPRITISWEERIKGFLIVENFDMAARLIRRCLQEDAWVQQQLYALYTDKHDRLLCIRRIAIGDSQSCLVDTRLLYDIGIATGAYGVVLGLTRPSGRTENSFRTDDFITNIDNYFSIMGLNLHAFYTLTRDAQSNLTTEMATRRLMQRDVRRQIVL